MDTQDARDKVFDAVKSLVPDEHLIMAEEFLSYGESSVRIYVSAIRNSLEYPASATFYINVPYEMGSNDNTIEMLCRRELDRIGWPHK